MLLEPFSSTNVLPNVFDELEVEFICMNDVDGLMMDCFLDKKGHKTHTGLGRSSLRIINTNLFCTYKFIWVMLRIHIWLYKM